VRLATSNCEKVIMRPTCFITKNSSFLDDFKPSINGKKPSGIKSRQFILDGLKRSKFFIGNSVFGRFWSNRPELIIFFLIFYDLFLFFFYFDLLLFIYIFLSFFFFLFSISIYWPCSMGPLISRPWLSDRWLGFAKSSTSLAITLAATGSSPSLGSGIDSSKFSSFFFLFVSYWFSGVSVMESTRSDLAGLTTERTALTARGEWSKGDAGRLRRGWPLP
jgi:hypothetical protein